LRKVYVEMRRSEIVDVLNRKNLPSEKEFRFLYSHISRTDAKEYRRAAKKRKPRTKDAKD